MSQRKRVTEKVQRTPEELAELREERARFSRERPGPDDLAASGDYEGPYRQGNIIACFRPSPSCSVTGICRASPSPTCRSDRDWTVLCSLDWRRQGPESDNVHALALRKCDWRTRYP